MATLEERKAKRREQKKLYKREERARENAEKAKTHARILHLRANYIRLALVGLGRRIHPQTQVSSKTLSVLSRAVEIDLGRCNEPLGRSSGARRSCGCGASPLSGVAAFCNAAATARARP